MPGCSAINCSNSASKGFLMKHFPKDKVRRKLWLVKMKRDNWSPTNYSSLCEVSFNYFFNNFIHKKLQIF